VLDVKQIREDFPPLSVIRNNKPIVYLDSACMSLKPKMVFNALREYYEEHTACGGRSHHYFGLVTTRKVQKAREKVAKLINAEDPDECVWVRNATEAINYVANGLSYEERNIVISEDSAHNSNLVPWLHLQERGTINHQLLNVDLNGMIDLDELSVLLSNKTRLVSLGHISNVLGSHIPAREIISMAHDHGAYVLLDAAQSFPHQKIDVRKLDVDFIAFSMHKACGPSLGVLYGKKTLLEDLDQTLVGGETVVDVFRDRVIYAKSPERFEAGLQNYAGIIAAGAAIDYLDKIGMESIEKHEKNLSQRLVKGIEELPFPSLRLLGSSNPNERCALATLDLGGDVNPHEVSMMLEESANLFLRAGFHCTHAFHHKHGLENGTLRPSFYLYNSEDDVLLFLETLEEILSVLT
jgi:cysteine desulfurase/selenocysteine lyase